MKVIASLSEMPCRGMSTFTVIEYSMEMPAVSSHSWLAVIMFLTHALLLLLLHPVLLSCVNQHIQLR